MKSNQQRAALQPYVFAITNDVRGSVNDRGLGYFDVRLHPTLLSKRL